MRLAVVAQPDDRRTGLLLAAAAAAGLPPVTVVPWRAVAGGAPVDLGGATAVRIESPGEDAEVARLLRGDTTPIGYGEIAGLGRWYSGLIAAARRVEQAAPAGARLLNPVDDLAVLFDKRRCHAVLSAAGVPVPPALPAVTGWADLRARMAGAGWRRVFVKPAHGSSASGVIALVADGARTSAVTSVERAPDGRLFNALPVRRYTDEAQIAAIVDRLAPDGLHVERWFPKAAHAGLTLDLRVVVIDGRAAHVVVRSSRSPLTNLHLGNARGDLAGVRAAAGETNWAAAMRTCERAAAQFPGSLHAGVDLMFAPGWERHAVAEVNAFGDLLPGLLVDGRDTYATELAALLR
ncbi:STM4014 family protein [Actinoplanes xinjiangensis]|uniref:STM4014 family protein n=1 Tax=Actinoplanes xinjiangensis TaxID=512350 RepID=UPI00344A4AEA